MTDFCLAILALSTLVCALLAGVGTCVLLLRYGRRISEEAERLTNALVFAGTAAALLVASGIQIAQFAGVFD